MTVGKDITVPIITEVQQNSPASKAGLKSNDQITFIDDKKIESINDVALYITTSKSDKVKVEVLEIKDLYLLLLNLKKKLPRIILVIILKKN